MVFWVMTPCSDAVGYQRFGGSCRLHLLHAKDESTMAVRNVGVLPHHYTVSYPKDFDLVHKRILQILHNVKLQKIVSYTTKKFGFVSW
jgi:hypothetical protein